MNQSAQTTSWIITSSRTGLIEAGLDYNCNRAQLVVKRSVVGKQSPSVARAEARLKTVNASGERQFRVVEQAFDGEALSEIAGEPFEEVGERDIAR
jgi:hypothetical protein